VAGITQVALNGADRSQGTPRIRPGIPQSGAAHRAGPGVLYVRGDEKPIEIRDKCHLRLGPVLTQRELVAIDGRIPRDSVGPGGVIESVIPGLRTDVELIFGPIL